MMYLIIIVAAIGYILFTYKNDKELSMRYRDYIKCKTKDGLILGSVYGLLLYVKDQGLMMVISGMLVCIVTILAIKTISYILKNKLS